MSRTRLGLLVIPALIGCTSSGGIVTAAEVPAADVIRFVAVGDTGHGNDAESAVARAMASVCQAHGGCALALLLGDNIYPAGVTSADDPQMETKFGRPFAVDRFPFYGALGNHDYGRHGWEFWRAEAEIQAAALTSYPTKEDGPATLRMPARHYMFGAGPIEFFAVDTNALFWGAIGDEETALRAELAATQRPWRIAFGHHPYVSNGRHGNAGSYDRLHWGWLPAAGGALRDFFESDICGKVDVYLSGHDHTLQDLGEVCGTQFLVSGAGSETVALGNRDATKFQASTPGFLYIEATRNSLSFTFYDQNAHALHQRTVTRP